MIRPKENKNVYYVTENPFDSDMFNKRFADLAGMKVVEPLVYSIEELNNSVEVIINGGSFIDHRGIRFDFNYGKPLTSTIDKLDGQLLAMIIYYDKSIPLNYEVELKLKFYLNKEFALDDELDNQEALVLLYDLNQQKEIYSLPIFGREYLKDLEHLDKEMRKVIQDELDKIEQIKTDIEDQLNTTKDDIANSLNEFKDDMSEELDARTRVAISVKKEGKDEDGTFLTVLKDDENGDPFIKSVLSEKNADGKYTKRELTINIGTPNEKTYNLEIIYDDDGDLIGENIIQED